MPKQGAQFFFCFLFGQKEPLFERRADVFLSGAPAASSERGAQALCQRPQQDTSGRGQRSGKKQVIACHHREQAEEHGENQHPQDDLIKIPDHGLPPLIFSCSAFKYAHFGLS